ncbi:hypothetical protein [Stakelama pacifica]|uniref:Lysylphosphatidylglycerol synthase-like protein n=1 Tax=Stakelama pacifica TaxID=517720 RepID=A0A4R6FEY6_9SPHN|nr:hypothetical protein [Stakelama pacifica]TDN79270.1 hypothetical protein EV664_11348 [Stakelama pacifica]GGO98556.1 hypothetical protein GCM10011329_30010 [Stakelama pacifica]
MKERIARLRCWGESPTGKRVARVARWLFFAAMVTWLVLKVDSIGWREVARSLPTNPLFYLLFVVMFLMLPASETLIFRLILGGGILREFPIFIRKRILNAALIGYSGEVYYFLWAERNLGLPPRRILLGIKDNAILSAVSSALITALLLAAFVATGQASAFADWLDSATGWIIAGGLAIAFVAPFAYRLRRRIFSIPLRTALAVLGIHMARITIVVLLQATQWAIVLPQAPWSVWILFLTMQMVVSRLPLIPNRDLLFLSAGLQLSGSVHLPQEAMAGLLLAGGALTQGSNLLFFLLTSIFRPADIPQGESLPSDDTLIATPPAR